MTSSSPILVFDLDDTLYDELSYVRSGLAAVARFVAAETGADVATLRQFLDESLALGRSQVFDRAFARAGLGGRRLIRRALGVYRLHRPEITLYPAAERCLERFAGLRTFIVTDGNSTVQARKVAALGLESRVERAFLTYRHGHHRAKPSPWCFERIRALTGAPAADVIYVGDNPAKDFVGIRPLGYGTIRVLTGQHAQVVAKPGFDAARSVPDLDALTPDALREFHDEHKARGGV